MYDGLALIAGGGGMRCAYGAGVLSALGENFDVKEPSVGIASSGSAGSFSYYLSEQYSQLRKAWEGLLCRKEVINPFRLWKIFDIDYLIDEIFKKEERLDLEKLNSKRTRFFISATNAKTGQLEYFLVNNNGADIFELMRASKSMPIFSGYGKRVRLDKGEYLDTYDNSLLGDNVRKAVNEGARKIVVIKNGESDRFVRNVFGFWFKFQTEDFKRTLLSYSNRDVEKEVDVFYLSPKNNLEIKTLERDERILKRVFEQGYDDTLSNDELKRFLGV